MRNLTTWLAIAAFVLSALAFSMSLGGFQEPAALPLPGTAPVAVTPGSKQAEEITRVDQRLSEIEARLAHHEEFSTTRQEIADDRPTIEDLVLRLAILEKTLPEPRSREQTRSIDVVPVQGRRTTSSSLKLLLSIASDPTATVETKLSALHELRGKKLGDGTDARLRVLDEMISIGQFAPDADHRADAWRQLSRVTDARVRQPLLSALASDPDAKMREEAAETLAHFLPDMAIEQALRWSADHDDSDQVRRQAASALK